MENIEICLKKTISKTEREILQNVNEKMDKEFRDFIIFSLNKLELGVITTEKGNIKVDLSILETSIKDYETIITDPQMPKGKLLINEDFKDMIIMEDKKGIGMVSMVMRKKESFASFSQDDSIIIENKSEIIENNNAKKEIKKFLELKYSMDKEKNLQNIDIIIQNIVICFSMSTMIRLYQFYKYYFGIYVESVEDTILDLAKMERKHKKKILSSKLRLSKKLSGSLSDSTFDSELDDDKDNEFSEEDLLKISNKK